jgi:hypothetical protein
MNSKKSNWKDQLAGLGMPPKRAPAKVVKHHHSTDQPIKRAAPVVHPDADGYAKTVATDPGSMPSPDSILRQLNGGSNPADFEESRPVGEDKGTVQIKNGNGNGEKSTSPERPNAKAEGNGNKKYFVEYTQNDIPGIQIFGNHASIIKNDIIIENKPTLRNRGAKYFKIKLECVENEIRLVSIEPKEVEEVVKNAVELFLVNKGKRAKNEKDLTEYPCSYTFGMELTYPTHNFSEQDIKAPVMRTTSSGKPVELPSDADGSKLLRLTPVYGIELGNPYKLPDQNGYVYYLSGKEYHIRLLEETDTSYKFRLSKRVLLDEKDKKGVIEPIGEFLFDKSNEEEHAGFASEKMWVTLTKHKNGERSIAVLEWNPNADIAQDPSIYKATKIVTALVSAASAATLFFLPELADQFRDQLNLISMPESVDLAYIGSVPLRQYLAAPAVGILAAGLTIIKLIGRTKKGDTQ